MAKIDITRNWQALPYLSGTVGNYGIVPVELSSDQVDGIVIEPNGRFSFDDTQLYIRSKGQATTVTVVPFVESNRMSNAEQIGEEVIEADQANSAGPSDIDSIF